MEREWENVSPYLSACRRHNYSGMQIRGGVPQAPLTWRSRDILRVSLYLQSCIADAETTCCSMQRTRTDFSGATKDSGHISDWDGFSGCLTSHVTSSEVDQWIDAMPLVCVLVQWRFLLVCFDFGYSASLRLPQPQDVSYEIAGACGQCTCGHAWSFLDFSACRRPLSCEEDVNGRSVRHGAITAQDEGTGWDWLFGIEQWGCGCVHSVQAILLASLLRLLFMACKLKGGRHNVDPWIYQSRRVLRPAPVYFWILLAVTCTQSVHAVRGANGNRAWTSDVWADIRRMDMHIQLEMSAMHDTNVVQSAEFLEVPLVAQLPQDWIVEQAPNLQPDVRIAVRLLQFQHCDRYTAVWTRSGMSGEELISRTTSMILADQDHYHIYDAYPQPPSDQVVLGISPRWWRNSDMVPVFIDAEAVHRHMALIAVPKTCTYYDLKECLSFSLWPPDTQLFYESNTEALREDQTIRPTEGSLFRVIPLHAEPDHVRDLADSMDNLDWAWDVQERGFPPEPNGEGRLLIMGPDHTFVIGPTHNLSFSQVVRQVAGALSVESSDLAFYVPNEDIESMAFKGRPVDGVMAVDFRDHTGYRSGGCGIFIDSRDLGMEVTFHRFNTRVLSCEDILDALDADVPSGYHAEVEGFDHVASQQGFYVFKHGDVVNVWMEPNALASSEDESCDEQPSEGPENPEDDANIDGDDASDRMDAEQQLTHESPALGNVAQGTGRDRSRTPRRLGDCTACSHVLLDGGPAMGDDFMGLSFQCGHDGHLLDVGQQLLPTALELADKSGLPEYLATVLGVVNGTDCERRFLRGNAAPCRAISTPCRTLVCKLPQLAADHTQSTSQTEDVGPRPVRLAEHVGPVHHDISVNCLRIIDSEDLQAIWSLVQPWKSPSLGPGPPWEQLHESTRQALSLCTDYPYPACPQVLEIYTDGSAKQGAAGFSVVLVGQWPEACQTTCLGCFGGPVTTDIADYHYVKAESHDAFNAEVTALFWAIMWCLGHWDILRRPWITIRYDARVAGCFASGRWETGQAGIGEFAREAARLLEQCIGADSIRWEHTKAHCGQPWNEMADTVAESCRMGRQSGIPKPDPGWPFLIGGVCLKWAALIPMSCAAMALPLNMQGQLCWKEGEAPPQPLAAHQVIPTSGDFSGQQIRLCLKVASANVQTCIGKYKFLEQQLLDRGIEVFCVQEARSREGCIKSADFIRFASDGRGHWGAEVWVSRHACFAELDGHAVGLDETCMFVRSSSPRHLHLEIDVAGHKVHVASVHYPQRNRDEDEKKQYDQVVTTIMAVAKGHTCIIGMDANGRVPLAFSTVTGRLFEDEDDDNGRRLVQVAALHGMWFPSTFECCQQGPGKTWTQAAGGRSRIDYFVINDEIPRHAVTTKVMEDFDLLTPNDDHDPIQLAMDFSFVKWCRNPARLKRGNGLDIRKLREPERLAAFEEALDRSGINQVHWDVDVNTHALWFQHAVHSALSVALPKKCDVPRSPYIPEQAWQIRARKQRLKKLTIARKTNFKGDAREFVFLLWRGRRGDKPRQLRWALQKAVVLYELCAGAIQLATANMQRLIRDKKNQMLQGLASKFGRTRPDEIMGQLKELHLGRRKRAPWKKHLPCLATCTRAANSRGALDAIWLEHFGKMEFGSVVKAVNHFGAQTSYADADHECELEVSALPSFADVEAAFRSTKCHKAPGLDLIFGEVLKWAPGRMAAAALPLMCKASARRVQPVQWRGGILAESYKGKGPLSDPSAYRSLYVSSMVGKAYHRIIRQKAAPIAVDTFDESHFSAKKGVPVTAASLLIAQFERWQYRLNQSAAVVYLDIQSAYYSVVRQLAYGDGSVGCDDAQICAVLKHFDLPRDVWDELIKAVQTGGIMGQYGTSGHVRTLVKDAHDGSCFVTRYADGQHVCLTEAGSRPGESLADLIYAWIFHAVLRDIKVCLRKMGVLQCVPFTGDLSPYAGSCAEELDFLGTTWADDSTFACADRDPTHLVHKTRLLLRAIVDQCAVRGLIPNRKPGKTSVVLSLRGKGSRKEQLNLFGGGDRHLTVHTERFGQLQIPVVPTYVHLGCAVEKGMNMETEAHRRGAIAATAFEPLRQMVFQNTSIPPKIRGQLFTVFIDSTYFNLEIWRGPVDRGWKRLELGHQQLTKRLLAKDLPAEEIHKLTPAEITCLTSHPPLWIIHKSKRLRFLVSLINAAPPVLWALIQAEESWGENLLQDLAWMRSLVAPGWPEISPQHWPLWWHSIKESPRRFRSAVARAVHNAKLLFMFQGLTQALMDSMQRCVARAFPVVEAVLEVKTWMCFPCKLVFKSRANLACHFFKKHQRVAPHRLYQGDVVCPNCLHDYGDVFRMQMHLKKNPRCLQFAISHGLCGGEAGPGTGSRVWKDCKRNNPIMCPPVSVDVAEIPEGPHRGHTGSPVQGTIASLVGKLGEELIGCVDGEGLELLHHRFQPYLLAAPLFQDELMAAIDQVAEDVRLCVEDGVLPWSPHLQESVFAALKLVKQRICSSWLVDAALGEDGSEQFAKKLDVQHIPHVRSRLSATASGVAFITCSSDHVQEPERTHITRLLTKLPWKYIADASVARAALSTVMVVQVCFRKGEAAAQGAGHSNVAECRGRDSPAALEHCHVHNEEQAKHFHEVCKVWKGCWRLLVEGRGVGIVCNGPKAWCRVLQDFPFSEVCCWKSWSSDSCWVLTAFPAPA